MIVRSRFLLPMKGPLLEDGAVLIRNGTVEAVGRYADVRRAAPPDVGATCDLGEQVLLPGLINAHCHLDYTGLRGQIPPPENGFAAWVGRINALKAALEPADYRKAIIDGFAELRRGGVTTVFNLEAFPELLAELPPPPLRTWWFPELIDVRDPSTPGERVAAALAAGRQRSGAALGGLGLAPHAPYTVSAALYRACAETGVPVTTHLAESADEAAMFREARGPLYDFLKAIGRPMNDCGEQTSFGQMARSGQLRPGWLLAHLNELEEADFNWIATHPGPWRVVHCPRSHAFFRHRPFQWERLRALGVEISLGTDSLASSADLNLFAELRAAREANPGLGSDALLEAVTLNPARAVGEEGRLGCIAPGAFADLVAVPYAGDRAGVAEAVIHHDRPGCWMMVAGQVLLP